jgi:hypothetical protein
MIYNYILLIILILENKEFSVGELNIKEFIIPLITMFIITMMSTAWKEIITKIFDQLKRLITVQIYISNRSWVYVVFSELIESLGETKNIRTVRFYLGRWGEESTISLALGNGFHILHYKGRILWIKIIEKSNSFMDETLGMTITSFGKDNRWIFDLREDLHELKIKSVKKDGKIKILFFKDSCYWSPSISISDRKMDSIFLKNQDKQKLINVIEDFNSSKEWYEEMGINYKLGVLLSGPPGTGKTSIIKAVASYFKRNIAFLKATELNSIKQAMLELPLNTILVVEDIDANKVTHKRKEDENSPTVLTVNASLGDSGPQKNEICSLSDILNTIDGLITPPGCIIFITTNHPEYIDEALFRPGRIDLHLEIDFVTMEVLIQFIKKFYKIDTISLTYDGPCNENLTREVLPNITTAMLQNAYLQDKLSYQEMIDHFTVWVEK